MKYTKNEERTRRHQRIRKKISGNSSIPRLCVYKSNKFIYVQLIDDEKGTTLASSSSMKMDLKQKSNIAAAVAVGKDIGAKIKSLKVNEIVFDRSGYLYHGKIQALADAVRESGIKF